jgi:gluconolactonase
MKKVTLYAALILFCSCNNQTEKNIGQTIGQLEKYDPTLDSIIAPNTKAEIIAAGFDWSEGPLWVESQQMLLFSDVPLNTVYQWTEKSGTKVYLKPSGFTGNDSKSKEPGSNGLTLDSEGRLVLCQHGNRQIAIMDAALDKPQAKFISLANKYEGKKFSSPNDLVFNNAGELFFTDPPYGLEKRSDDDPQKETTCNGVYKVKKDGTVLLLVDSITRPNGIAFSPDQKKILIACSDPAKPNWYVFDVDGDTLTNGKIFYSALGFDKSWKGMPDGFKIGKNGIVYASGPGGIYFFNLEGKKLGLLHLTESASNCALSADEKTLYITNDMYVLRVKLKS